MKKPPNFKHYKHINTANLILIITNIITGCFSITIYKNKAAWKIEYSRSVYWISIDDCHNDHYTTANKFQTFVHL